MADIAVPQGAVQRVPAEFRRNFPANRRIGRRSPRVKNPADNPAGNHVASGERESIILPLFVTALRSYSSAMQFGRLKNYMPRGLYGRAALILIVPIVTLQLVVSIVVIQRLFEDVTRQMTQNILPELRYLLNAADQAPSKSAAEEAIRRIADPLSIEALYDRDGPVADSRLSYDLSGITVIRTLRAGLDGIAGINLASDDKIVQFAITTMHGPLEIRFPRRRVSARNPHHLLVLTLFTTALMMTIAPLFLRNQLRPIMRLARAAEAFGKGQTMRYHPAGATEVRAAGRSFLEMRARIERQTEQRTLMLSGVSHDLRTPLTRLRLGLSALEESDETEALRRDMDDMERLLDGFLNFVRGGAADEMEKVGPIQLAREAVARAQRMGNDVILAKAAGEDAPVSLELCPKVGDGVIRRRGEFA